MPVELNVDNIPASLGERAQWVCWKYIRRDGKETKCPIRSDTGGKADASDPGTWSTLEAALASFRSSKDLAGVGFVFSPEDQFCGIDLDDCLDRATREAKPWAQRIVAELDSYTEISPSGHGVKIFLRAAKPGRRCRRAWHDGEVEMYDRGRFFTVTGAAYNGSPTDVNARQDALNALYREIFADGEPGSTPTETPTRANVGGPPTAALADADILDLARSPRRKNGAGEKFTALWDGRWNDHFNSASEADSSVCFTLAYYTKDAAQIDRMFRTSGLMRAKWDEYHGEQTYGEMTIAKALANVTGQYRPRRKRRKAKPARAAPPKTAAGLPTIIVSDVQLSDLTVHGQAALHKGNDPPVIFVRSGSLVRVVRDERGRPVIEAMDKAKVRSRLTDVATFFAVDREGAYVGTNPPVYLAENILAQGRWDYPPLIGIARSPILRPDGSICTTAGYDGQTKLFYSPDPDLVVPAIPERPTEGDMGAATGLLSDLIAEFPFADEASRANALAILLSILMRPVVCGHIPLAIIDAPMQGTGKTLLATILGIVGVGSISGESIPARQNEDEWRKKITAILLAASPLVLLDNIPDNSTIDSSSLAAALTSQEWSDRLLGKSENIRLPSRAVWVATGNNLRISGDMPRRCYTIRLDANAERPWERTGFSHPDLEQYARTCRGDLLAAAFTLIRAWYASGKPQAPDLPAFGSFQEWTNTVGGVLVRGGIEGFLGNLGELRAVQDEDTQQWAAFFTTWRYLLGELPVTADDLCQRILAHDTLTDDSLPDVLLVNRDRGEGSLKRSLGRNLSRLTGRIFGGYKLCHAGRDGNKHVRRWRLIPVKEGQDDLA